MVKNKIINFYLARKFPFKTQIEMYHKKIQVLKSLELITLLIKKMQAFKHMNREKLYTSYNKCHGNHREFMTSSM